MDCALKQLQPGGSLHAWKSVSTFPFIIHSIYTRIWIRWLCIRYKIFPTWSDIGWQRGRVVFIPSGVILWKTLQRRVKCWFHPMTGLQCLLYSTCIRQPGVFLSALFLPLLCSTVQLCLHSRCFEKQVKGSLGLKRRESLWARSCSRLVHNPSHLSPAMPPFALSSSVHLIFYYLNSTNCAAFNHTQYHESVSDKCPL